MSFLLLRKGLKNSILFFFFDVFLKHCQHGEDEEYEHCYLTYIDKKVIPEYGTIKCPSLLYPDISTVAVVCDGVPECTNSKDEPNICRNLDFLNSIVYYSVIIFLILGSPSK